MNKHVIGLTLFALAATSGVAMATTAEKAAQQATKVTDATAVYHELISTPDRGAPKELLENCKCVAVLPGVLKAAVGYGVEHGSGVMSCRTAHGWSAPAFVNISGGSVGFQLGAESTDLVVFFMNDRGARSLVHGSQLTLGGKASVAAGPIGRTGEAATNLELKAEIYSYARSKGLFAGLSVEGARLAPNPSDITNYYGKGMTYDKLLFGSGPSKTPKEAELFRNTLSKTQDVAAR
jgi:SH3 domain-containing YSC84-like protein 1